MGEPIGEDAWVDFVDEESRTAGHLEQRVEVVELYKRATSAEPYSLRLWLAYCEWFWSLHTDCQSGDAGWPEEEQQLGQELFSLETALDVWQQGVQATLLRLNDSHILWNRYISIELELLGTKPSIDGIKRVRELFIARLQIPHATWEDTSQIFSVFLTKYDEAAYEETMVQTTKLAKPAKEIYDQRETHEIKLQRAIESTEKEILKTSVTEYLEWENSQSIKKGGNPFLCVALYERVLVLLGTEAAIWEDYVVFLNGHIGSIAEKRQVVTTATIPDLLSVLQRATKHCPWSGSLWSRYILKADIENLSFGDIEQIKHAATSTGQLDRNGMVDVLAVYSAWCSVLRRRATSKEATDEDVDVADVGLLSALESVQEWGERLYGKDVYKGDPTFQLERSWIQYLTQRGIIDEAREQWNKLIKTHGNSYEFWQRYYMWEMTIPNSPPSLATAVLRQATNKIGLDWPEKIMEIYLQHCVNYEDAVTLAEATDLVHRKAKGVAKRRQREAADASATYATQQTTTVDTTAASEPASEASPSATSKRKRDSVSEVEGGSAKRLKEESSDASSSQALRRDRENTSVLVQSLPAEVTQTKIRQYFKEYGHINNLSLNVEQDGSSSTALIEFRSVEEAQSALLRDGKYFTDRQISVRPGTSLTLYVTNYPPTADEAYIRNLFKNAGGILSIRWPSLKFNTHRRFCYVSFKSPEASAAATELDGKFLEGRYKLEVKYSDPGKKKQREGAMTEGRELHVANIDRSATEQEVREIFTKYGTVESARILKNMAGKSKGSGFIVFEKKEEAVEALALDKTKFRSQLLTVELATATNFKPTANSVSKGSSASPAPDADSDVVSGSMEVEGQASNTHAMNGPSRSEIAERTITLLNVPDTVNDARVRALVDSYGAVSKITLRPDHQGAIIEFADVITAGKAALGLEGHEIVPGRKLRTGGIKDLFQEKAEHRTDKIQIGTGGKKAAPSATPSATFIKPSIPVRRPGGRGGLGMKRGLGFAAATSSGKGLTQASQTNGHGSAEGAKEGQPQPKSNADFKAMFLEGQKKD